MIFMGNFERKITKVFMAEVGVSNNVEFKVTRLPEMPWYLGKNTWVCKFINDVLYVKRYGKWEECSDLMEYVSHMRDYSFEVQEFNPQEMDLYYFVTPRGTVSSGHYYHLNTPCVVNKLVGNCFATREQAENNMGKIIKKFNSIKGGESNA